MHSGYLLLLGGLLVLAACSSGQKKQAATLPTAIVQKTEEATIPTVTQPQAKKDEITCERGQEKRTLHIEPIDPKGCKLWYSHYSTKDPVASSKIANTHCEKVQTIIRGHLEEAKFSCNGSKAPIAKTAAMTTTTPAATPSPTPSPTPTPGASPTAPSVKK